MHEVLVHVVYQQACHSLVVLAVLSDELEVALFFEGNGPARQGLCGLDFWPCLSSELSSPSVPLAAARARHTRQRLSCGPEATAAL